MKENGLTTIQATSAAEAEWRTKVMDFGYRSLVRKAKTSWYMGGNIPGKAIEPLNYSGGILTYVSTLNGVAKNGYEGFRLMQPTT